MRLTLLAVALACWLASASSVFAASPAQELADRYAPIVALKAQTEPCDSVGEPYRPTSVDIVLGNPEVTLRGPGKRNPVVTDAPTAADLYGKGDGYFLDFPVAISACLLYFDRLGREQEHGLTPPREWLCQRRGRKSDVRLPADGLHDAGGADRDPVGGS